MYIMWHPLCCKCCYSFNNMHKAQPPMVVPVDRPLLLTKMESVTVLASADTESSSGRLDQLGTFYATP